MPPSPVHDYIVIMGIEGQNESAVTNILRDTIEGSSQIEDRFAAITHALHIGCWK